MIVIYDNQGVKIWFDIYGVAAVKTSSSREKNCSIQVCFACRPVEFDKLDDLLRYTMFSLCGEIFPFT